MQPSSAKLNKNLENFCLKFKILYLTETSRIHILNTIIPYEGWHRRVCTPQWARTYARVSYFYEDSLQCTMEPVWKSRRRQFAPLFPLLHPLEMPKLTRIHEYDAEGPSISSQNFLIFIKTWQNTCKCDFYQHNSDSIKILVLNNVS